MKKRNLVLSFVCILVLGLGFISCEEPIEPIIPKDQLPPPLGALRAIPIATDLSGLDPVVLVSYTSGGQNFYLIDVGQISNTYISSVIPAAYYPGHGTATYIAQTITEQTIINATTQTVSNSITMTDSSNHTLSISASAEAKYKGLFTSGKFETNVNSTWVTESTQTSSFKEVMETSLSEANKVAQSMTTSLALSPGTPVGYHRIAMYARSRVFFFIATSIDNQTLLGWETVVAASDSFFVRQEFCENNVFDNSPITGNVIDFADGFYKNLAVDSNPIIFPFDNTPSPSGNFTIPNDVDLARFVGQYDKGIIFNNFNIIVANRSEPLIIEFVNFGMKASTDNIAIRSNSNVVITISFRGNNRILGGDARTTTTLLQPSGNPGSNAIDLNGGLILTGGGKAHIEGGIGSGGRAGSNQQYDASNAEPFNGGTGGSGGAGGNGIRATNLSIIGVLGDVVIKGGNGGNGGTGGTGGGVQQAGVKAGRGGHGGAGGVGGHGITLNGNFNINLQLIAYLQILGGTGGHGNTGGRGGLGHWRNGNNSHGGDGGNGGQGGNGGNGIHFANVINQISGSSTNDAIIVRGGNGGNGANGGQGGDASNSGSGAAGTNGPGGNGGNGGNGGAAIRLATAPAANLLQLQTSAGGSGGQRGVTGVGTGLQPSLLNIGNPGAAGQQRVW